MGPRVLLLLFLLAAGLGATLWLTDEKPPIEKTVETSVLGGRSLTSAVRLRWQFRDRPAVELGRAPDGRFRIEEPIVDIASHGYMRQIVTAWDSANMRATPLADDEDGRRQAGLAPPELTFLAWFADGERVEVEVGDPGPLGSTRFLRRDGRIWEGSTGLIESMRVGLADLRERSVFRHAFAQANEVRVEQQLAPGRREALHLAIADGEWRLREPVQGRADPVAAQRFVTAVLDLRVDWFHEGIVRFPEGAADIVVTVRGTYGEEQVSLWEEEGQVYGQLPDRGVNFTSDNRQYSAIFVNAVEELRARILVPMGESTFEELVELVVDPGQGRGDRTRLVRTAPNSPWQLVEPVEYAARATPVNEAAYALQRLVAKRFVDADGIRPRAEDPRYGLTGARWTVATRRVREREVHTLWFGDDATGADAAGLDAPHVYVCRSDEPDNVALAPKQPLEVLQRDWTDYCALQVVRQPAIVERLVLAHRDGRRRVFRTGSDGWVLESGGDARPEVGEFAADVLRDLVGKRAVDMREGFGEPDWTLSMTRINGDELGLVRVWDRGDGQPLVAKGRSEQPVGLELGTRDSRSMRELWK